MADAGSQASELEMHGETRRNDIPPKIKQEKLNTSMYNISPIEVYIEKKPALGEHSSRQKGSFRKS